MYIVAQISPLEWKKASVCSHSNNNHGDEHGNDDVINNTEFHHSLNSLDGHKHEDFMTNGDDDITTIINENCCTMEAGDDNVDGDEVNGNISRNGEQMAEGVKVMDEGNCCENYSTSTLQQHEQYFKNMCVMNERNDLDSIWMNMEYRQNFLLNAKRQNLENSRDSCKELKDNLRRSNKDDKMTRKSTKKKRQRNEIGSSSKRFDENLDIDDDGLIGYVDERPNEDNCSELDYDEDLFDEDDFGLDDNFQSEDLSFSTLDDIQNIELISYVNNFSLKSSFAWTLGTLIQSTSDLYPKVSYFVCVQYCNVYIQSLARALFLLHSLYCLGCKIYSLII